MKLRTSLPTLVACALAAGSLTHARPLAAEGADTAERFKALARLVEAQLGGLDPMQLYVVTDKPLYHPGETVWFRAWELRMKALEGVPGEHGVTFQLLDPRGAKVQEKRVLYQAGMATNDFELGAGIVGGPYTLRAVSDLGSVQDRVVNVSAYELPRVKKTLELGRKSYGQGDEVTAKVLLQGATGEALHVAKATAVVTLDGAEIARFPVVIDWNGKGLVRFQLPRSITKGDASLTLLVDAGGINESIQKRIPIVLDRLDLTAYAEGGDLVVGLPSRVYVAAHDLLGKPAEAEGDVVDDHGRAVVHFRTAHAGMGRFALTPEAGRTYAMKLTKPRGVTQAFALPAARPSGCTLQSVDDYRSEEPELRVRAWCTTAQKVLATAVLRSRLVARATGEVHPGQAVELGLAVPKGAEGAVRVTLFDPQQAPLAERLVFRGLGSELHVTMTADRPSYAPREKVTLTVKTTDARGKAVPAELALAVVDDTVLNYAADKTGNMLAQLYLAPEMPGQTVDDPNYYFSKDFAAPEALDLVLGTQGWRRFAWRWVTAVTAAPATVAR